MSAMLGRDQKMSFAAHYSSLWLPFSVMLLSLGGSDTAVSFMVEHTTITILGPSVLHVFLH